MRLRAIGTFVGATAAATVVAFPLNKGLETAWSGLMAGQVRLAMNAASLNGNSVAATSGKYYDYKKIGTHYDDYGYSDYSPGYDYYDTYSPSYDYYDTATPILGNK